MTDLRTQTVKRLEHYPDLPDVAKAAAWLSGARPQALSDRPVEVKARDVLQLWRVRLKISMSKGHTLEGAPELLARLERMNPRAKLEQLGFMAPELMGNIFFQKASGAYVGSVLFPAPELKDSFQKAS